MSKRPPYHDWDEEHDEKKLAAFRKKVQEMADQEFGVDDTGDSSVRVSLLDRTRFQSSHFDHVPYGHRSEEGRKLAFEKTLFNLHVAHGAFETEDRIRKSHEAEAARKEKKP